MTLQNRVDPWGQLHAAPERGTMMGNRGGKFHRPDQTLGKRRWASTHWICCDMHFKNMKHDAMRRGYTSLFFLDEVTALAAGHRPCFFCRRKEAKDFLGDVRVGPFDEQLHIERTQIQPLMLRCDQREPRSIGGSRPFEAPQSGAPQGEGSWIDGMMVEVDGKAFAVKGRNLLQWSFSGYTSAIPTKNFDKVLTPPSIIAILQKGYQPRWHESAYQWD